MHRGASRWLVLIVAFAVSAVACGGGGGGGGSSPSSSTGQGARGGSFSMANCEATSLIPQKDYESCGAQIFEVLFTRLVSFDFKSGEPVMAQAQSITSDDQKVWTIKIRSGWTFHNGEPVTAQSYVDAWNWTALGSNGAILNFFFERIEGYDALNPSKGKATSDTLSGLKVIDPTTFEVTLTAPFSQFPLQLGYDAFDPLPKAFYDDAKAFNEQPIGDGPYMMDGAWKHDEMVKLKRYPDYAGTPGFADEIRLPEYSGEGDFPDLEAGNIDIDLVGSSHLAQAQQEFPDSLQRHPSSSILWLAFPLYDRRFQNNELRQALSLSVDRGAVMKAILVNEIPADSFASPVVAGYRSGACTYCHLDVEAAKQKLADAGGWQGELTLNFPADDPVLEQAMEAVANQWRQNLGIQDIKLNPIDANSYFDVELSKKMTGPWFDGWVMDYPSIEDYLRPIYSKSGGYNMTGYSNPAFEQLLSQGDAASSLDASIAQYQQAEDMLAEDMPAIPWGYGGLNIVNQPTVTNVLKDGPIDLVALELVQVVG